MVYVLHKNGKPLMPTMKYGYVRFLLKTGKAEVVSVMPFTVRLTYKTSDVVQPLCAALDIGRTNIGVAVVNSKGDAVFATNVETRNKDIPKLMEKRKVYRNKHRRYGRRCKRQRRARSKQTVAKNGTVERILPKITKPIVCKFIKNKPACFCNRTRKEGWLTPTANQLLQTHVNIINKLQKLLPITDVAFEANKFAFMQLNDATVQGVQFCNGPLKGYDSVEDAVFDQQNGICLLCGQAPIQHYHHVLPKHIKGSNTVGNIVGLCKCCHDLVHTKPQKREELLKLHQGKKKEFGALGILNQISPYLLNAFEEIFPGHVYIADGKMTCKVRELFNAPKDHYVDAYCIAYITVDGTGFAVPDTVYRIKQYRRHDRQCCHQERIYRKYTVGKYVVATNRHRAYEQNGIALDEYIANGGSSIGLTVQKHKAEYKDPKRDMPGSVYLVNGKRKVLKRFDGKHNGKTDYYKFEDGTKISPKKCNKIQNNGCLVFVG